MLNRRLGCLEHPIRQEVYRWVCENPGAYFFEIANELAIPAGTLAWHLRVLEAEGLIEKIKFGGRVVFYPKHLRDATIEKAFLILRNDNARKIFEIIAANPGIHQSEIVERFGLNHDTVRWHIKRMIKAGLVSVSRRGRNSKYYIGEVGKSILNGEAKTISPSFVEFLLDRLHGERLKPELQSLEKSSLVIKIKALKPFEEERTLTIDLSKLQV